MAKLGISLPEEVAQKLTTLAKEAGKTISGVIADALRAYFTETSAPPIPQSPAPSIPVPDPTPTSQQIPPPAPPAPPPSPEEHPDLKPIFDQLKQIEDKIVDLQAQMFAASAQEKQAAFSTGFTQLTKEYYETRRRLLKTLQNPHLFSSPKHRL